MDEEVVSGLVVVTVVPSVLVVVSGLVVVTVVPVVLVVDSEKFKHNFHISIAFTTYFTHMMLMTDTLIEKMIQCGFVFAQQVTHSI